LFEHDLLLSRDIEEGVVSENPIGFFGSKLTPRVSFGAAHIAAPEVPRREDLTGTVKVEDETGHVILLSSDKREMIVSRSDATRARAARSTW